MSRDDHETSRDGQTGIPRRKFIVAGAASVAGLLALDGLVVEPRWLDVTRHTVAIVDLPRSLEGLRIAQVTDVHLQRLGSLHESVVDEIAAAGCRWVFVTGDMVDNTDALDDVRTLSRELAKNCDRVFATLGNWEHWSGVPIGTIRALYDDVGVELLVDEAATADGASIVGTDDGATGRADLRRAARAAETSRPLTFLLTHAPGVLRGVTTWARSFDLVLSGHTHGGQLQWFDAAPVTPPGSGDFVEGFYDTAWGRTYVCRGVGTSVVPARFMCRPELAIFEFARK